RFLEKWLDRRRRKREEKLQARVVKDEGTDEARKLATEALSDLDPEMRLLGQAEFIEDVDRLTDLFTNRLLPVGARAVALRRMALRAPAARAAAVLEFVLGPEAGQA